MSSLLVLVLLQGCSTRVDTPSINANSTIEFKPKGLNDVCADIVLSRRISRKTGLPIQSGTIFPIRDKETLKAFINIENRFKLGNRSLMLHVDWIDPDGVSFYRKQVNIEPNDSTSVINSSISLTPEIRQPGEYSIRIYLFRELIAEKPFQLLPDSLYKAPEGDEVEAEIAVGNKLNKTTDELEGIDSVFAVSQKGKIHALVNLKNRFAYEDEDLKFSIAWIGPDEKTIFTKRIEILASDSTNILKSAISVSPGTRQSGVYKVRVILFREVLAEKKFEIRIEQPVKTISKKSVKENVKAVISFCGKYDQKTGEQTDINTVFSIKEKGRVYAVVDLDKAAKLKNKDIKISLVWSTIDGKSIFRKQFEIKAGDATSTLYSSISATPDGRQPGEYQLQVYQFNKIIGQKKFILIEE